MSTLRDYDKSSRIRGNLTGKSILKIISKLGLFGATGAGMGFITKFAFNDLVTRSDDNLFNANNQQSSSNDPPTDTSSGLSGPSNDPIDSDTLSAENQSSSSNKEDEYEVQIDEVQMEFMKYGCIALWVMFLYSVSKKNNWLISQQDCRNRKLNNCSKPVHSGENIGDIFKKRFNIRATSMRVGECPDIKNSSCEYPTWKRTLYRFLSYSLWSIYLLGTVLITYISWG